MPSSMRAILDQMTAKFPNSNAAAKSFYEKTNWLCEVHYKSSDPTFPDFRIITNVRIAKTNNRLKSDIVLMREASVNSELWPYSFLANACQTQRRLDFL